MKNPGCIHSRSVCQLIGAAVLIGFLPSVHATLTMTLSGTPNSSTVQVSFSGSATVGRNSELIYDFGWDFVPTNFDPFPAQITGSNFGAFSFSSGSAQFLNVTRNVITPIGGVWLQDSSNSPYPGWERFGIIYPTPIRYAAGDLYQWSGSATINLSAKGLTFGSLHPGTTGPIVGLDPVMNGIFQAQLVIVPEPPEKLFGTAVLGGIVWLAITRRKVLAA